MSYNSKAYLAYEERLLEPSMIVHGTQRRHKPVAKIVVPGSMLPIERMRYDNEYQDKDAAAQDEWLKEHGIN